MALKLRRQAEVFTKAILPHRMQNVLGLIEDGRRQLQARVRQPHTDLKLVAVKLVQ